MKVNSIQQQNFRGRPCDKIVDKLAKNPKLIGKIAGLAGCSVIAQKLVMSSGEATLGPLVDIGVGKTITKLTNEKDGRTNQSSKVQAVRTFSQTIGGTITGIAIRALCIGAATAACMAAGKKAGSNIANILTQNGKIDASKAFEYNELISKWGKNIGGALATCVMMVTNFVIDAPLINKINKVVASATGINSKEKTAKEVK